METNRYKLNQAMRVLSDSMRAIEAMVSALPDESEDKYYLLDVGEVVEDVLYLIEDAIGLLERHELMESGSQEMSQPQLFVLH